MLSTLASLLLSGIHLQAQKSNPFSAEQQESIRNDILTLFKENDYFRKEIDLMFDGGIVGPDLGMTKEEVHAAMHLFVDYIRKAEMVRSPMPLSPVRFNWLQNQFEILPEYWGELLTRGRGVIFHEAVHASLAQMRGADQAKAAQEWLQKNRDRLFKTSIATARLEPEFRRVAWQRMAPIFMAEKQAYYLQMAFYAAKAREQGISIQEYFLNRAEPHAKKAGLATITYLEAIVSNVPVSDPAGYVLSGEWPMAKMFRSGQLTPAIQQDIFIRSMLTQEYYRSLLTIYCKESWMHNAIEGFRQSSLTPQAWAAGERLAEWGIPLFSRSAPPEEDLLPVSNHMARWTVLTLGLGALAFWRWRRQTEKANRSAKISSRLRHKKRTRSWLLPWIMLGLLSNSNSAHAHEPIMMSQSKPQITETLKPSPRADEIKRDVRELFRSRKFFKPEIARMFKGSFVSPDISMTQKELEKAAVDFVAFVDSPDTQIYETHDPHRVLAPDFLRKRLAVNPALWEAAKIHAVSMIFHEVVHFTKTHQELYRRWYSAAGWIATHYPVVRPEDEDRVHQDPEFRQAAWEFLSAYFKDERGANYLQTAFNAAFASLQSQSLKDYLFSKVQPLIGAEPITPDDFLDRAQLQGPKGPPIGYLVGNEWSYSTLYDRKMISEPFNGYVFLINLEYFPIVSSLLQGYALDPDIKESIRRQSNSIRIDHDRQLQLYRWIRETLLRESAPEAPNKPHQEEDTASGLSRAA